MAQWVKTLTAAAWVSVEVRVQSLAWCSGLKDPALLHLWLEFSPWPGNCLVPCVQTLKKKKSSEEAYVGRALSEGPVTAILLKTTRTEFVHVLTYSRSLLAFWPSPLAGGGGGNHCWDMASLSIPPPKQSAPIEALSPFWPFPDFFGGEGG